MPLHCAFIAKAIAGSLYDAEVKKAESNFDIKSSRNPFLSREQVDIFGKLGIDLMHTLYERYYGHYWDMICHLLNARGRQFVSRA